MHNPGSIYDKARLSKEQNQIYQRNYLRKIFLAPNYVKIGLQIKFILGPYERVLAFVESGPGLQPGRKPAVFLGYLHKFFFAYEGQSNVVYP